MPTPIIPQLVGAVITVTGANAIANNAYSVAADKLTIDRVTYAGLLVEFSLVPTWGVAPVAGSIALIPVGYDLSGTPVAGPAPVATLNNRFSGGFEPSPNTSNTATSWVMKLDAVPLAGKTDFYIYNTTGQQISAGWVLKAQVWTPGT